MIKATIDYLDSPELRAALQMKEPGERCEITLVLSTVDVGEETFVGTVEEIIYDMDGEEMTVEPTAEEPVSLAMFPDIDEDDADLALPAEVMRDEAIGDELMEEMV